MRKDGRDGSSSVCLGGNALDKGQPVLGASRLSVLFLSQESEVEKAGRDLSQRLVDEGKGKGQGQRQTSTN